MQSDIEGLQYVARVPCFEINNCDKKFQNECMFIIKPIYKIQKLNSFRLLPIDPIPLGYNATERLGKKGFPGLSYYTIQTAF